MPKYKTLKPKTILIWSLILPLMTAVTLADVSDIKVVAQADESGSSPKEGSTLVSGSLKTVTFEKEATIRQALKHLSQIFQKNIVPSNQVTGVIGFTKLYDVTFEEAMDAILGPNLVYDKQDQIIKVYTKEEYKSIRNDKERMIHKVFTLHYITAEEASKLIKPVLSSSAVIQSSSPAEKELGGAGGGGGGSGGIGSLGSGGGGDKLAQSDALVVLDFPENIKQAEKVINSLDERPKQVLIEATILSTVLTDSMELGVDLNFMAGFALDGTAATETIVSDGSIDRGSESTSPIATIDQASGTPIETAGFAAAGADGLRVGITTGDVRALITALESVTDTTVLANPKILTVNKQEGSVLIGTKLGYRSSTTISTGGVATSGEVKFLETGTRLQFRPYIGDDGYIRMDIYPKDGSATLNDDGVPTENTTELRTNIMVKDGETIVLGGLFRDVVTSTRKQIPLLGDIPLIGALFKGTTDRTQREEVMILLTPHIIDKAGQTEGEKRAADISRKRYGTRQELHEFTGTRLAMDHYTRAVDYYSDGQKSLALAELKEALRLWPTYLEAMRLKEKIIREVSPEQADEMERIMLDVIDNEMAPMWKRR